MVSRSREVRSSVSVWLMIVVVVALLGFNFGLDAVHCDNSGEQPIVDCIGDDKRLQEGGVNEVGGATRVPTFTHGVLAEDITAGWCPPCPKASDNLKNIYDSGDYPFYFVCLITQDKNQSTVNEDANDRARDDYNIKAYPTVMFDGGYREVVGGSDDESTYREPIEECGARKVPTLEISLTANHIGGAKLEITAEILNDNPEKYTGHLRVYITEIESRYNDYNGNPYPFGFLDYAFNENVEIEAGSTLVKSETWDGAEHQDGLGNSFADFKQGNIMVIATVFNSAQHIQHHPQTPYVYTAYWADQTVGVKVTEAEKDTILPSVTIKSPSNHGTVSGTVAITASANDNAAVNNVEYSVDSGPWNDMAHGTGDIYSALWDTTGVPDGQHTISVKATDTSSNVNTDSITVTVNNDDNGGEIDSTPPMVSITSPTDNTEVKSSVSITVTATDNVGISKVEYQIDSGTFHTMAHTYGDIYTGTWDTTQNSNGDYTITVRAADTSGNKKADSVKVKVVNIETTDSVKPIVKITSPDPSSEVEDTIEIAAVVTDNVGISEVEYRIDTGRWRAMWHSTGDTYEATWDTTGGEDGIYTISVKAEDTSGNIETDEVTVTVCNFKISGSTIPPTIKSFEHSPENPTASDKITITATVTSDNELESVKLYYRIEGKQRSPKTMKRASSGSDSEGDEYSCTIGPYEANCVIAYRIVATDIFDNSKESEEYKITVQQLPDEGKVKGAIPGFQNTMSLLALALALVIYCKRERK